MGLGCGTRREVSRGRRRGAGRRGGKGESRDGAGAAPQGWAGWTGGEAVTMSKGNFGTSAAIRCLFFTRLLARRKGVLVLRQTSCRMSRYVTSGPSAHPGNNTTSRSLPCPGPRWQLCACGKETLKHPWSKLFPTPAARSCSERAVPFCHLLVLKKMQFPRVLNCLFSTDTGVCLRGSQTCKAN